MNKKTSETDSENKSSDRLGRGEGRKVVYEVLRDQILSLELKPGTPLDEMQLSRQFGMSRSPIREALNRLSSEGLVVMLANRSTLVAPMDLTIFPRYVEALDLLQRATIRLAARNRTAEDLDEMLRCADQFDQSVLNYNHLEMSASNRVFHMAVAKAGRNPYLTRQYGQMLDEGRRMLHLHFDFLADNGNERLLTREHHEMIDAIRAQDVDAADALAHAHTRQFHQNFTSFLEAQYDNIFDFDTSVGAGSIPQNS